MYTPQWSLTPQWAGANCRDSLLWGHQGIQGASGCPKTKVVERKLEDQEDTRTTPDRDKDAATDAAADAATPATLQHGGAAAATGGVKPPLAPSTASSPAPSHGGKGAATTRAAGGCRKNATS